MIAKGGIESGKMNQNEPSGLLHRFAANVSETPDKTLFQFFSSKGKLEDNYTYIEFDKKTSAVAEYLKSKVDTTKTKNVLLVYPPGLDFVVTFIACLKAGLVAVPVYPPYPGKPKDVAAFVGIQSSCEATVALTTTTYEFAKKVSSLTQFLSTKKSKWPELNWLTTDKIKHSAQSNFQTVESTFDDLAFLQFTSGSTSKPKGVMLTHGNLAYNLEACTTNLKADMNAVIGTWLPQYHDMGLIGGILGTMYSGGSGYYMSPISFIQNPVLWLKLISKFRVTHTATPNFGVKFIVRKFNEFNKLSAENQVKKFVPEFKSIEIDLSSLKHIFNAAEPVSASAIDEFNSTFASYGLKEEAMHPGYGLAENTVYVCDGGKIRLHLDKQALLAHEIKVVHGAEEGTVLQGCGPVDKHSDIEIRIVKDSKDLGSDNIGEIWISSNSTASGYFNQPELSEQCLQARIEGNSSQWLRTGDLGFIHRGELFVCGRLKDLLIIRGRNHYPQDIELTVETEHEFSHILRPGCSAAFEHEGNLVIVVEVRKQFEKTDFSKVGKVISTSITGEHNVKVDEIVFIKQGTIVKTTSGKIKRHGVLAAYVKNELKRVDQVKGESVTRKGKSESTGQQDSAMVLGRLKEEVGNLLGLTTEEYTSLEVSDVLSSLGLDSLGLSQLKGVIESEYSIEIEDEVIFNKDMTLEVLEEVIQLSKQGKPVDLEELVKGRKINKPTPNPPKSKPKSKFPFCC